MADLQQADEKNPNGRGIIESRDRKGCGPTVAKMYKLTPERWKQAPYYEPKAMELEDVPEEDEDDAQIPELAVTDAPEREVNPGKVSKPQTVTLSPSRGAPAVSIRLVYRSTDLPYPVAFKATPGRNGRVQISCRATTLQRFAPLRHQKHSQLLQVIKLLRFRRF